MSAQPMKKNFQLDEYDSAETIQEGEIEVFADLEVENVDDGIDEHEETVHLDEDDLIEFEDPTPAPRKPKPKQRHESEIVGEDGREEYGESAFIPRSQMGTGYLRRWCAGQFGFMAAWCAYAGVQWKDLELTWNHLLRDSQVPMTEHYIAVAAAIWVVAIIIAAILAAFDRSALRCIQLGIAWCAIAIIAVTALSLRQPAQIQNANDRFQVTAAMLQASLSPVIHARKVECLAIQNIIPEEE